MCTIVYVSKCFRRHNVQLTANLLQLGRINAPIDDGIAVRADANQVTHRLGQALIVRHVAGGRSGCPASDAVDFSGFTSALVLCPSCLKKCREVTTKNQHWPPVIDGWQSLFYPFAHGVFMNSIQDRNFFHRVVAMNLGKARIWSTLSHYLSPKLRMPRCWKKRGRKPS